jgi:hypothetical protein
MPPRESPPGKLAHQHFFRLRIKEHEVKKSFLIKMKKRILYLMLAVHQASSALEARLVEGAESHFEWLRNIYI